MVPHKIVENPTSITASSWYHDFAKKKTGNRPAHLPGTLRCPHISKPETDETDDYGLLLTQKACDLKAYIQQMTCGSVSQRT